MDDKRISIAVIKRLPRYYRYLSDLLEHGITRVSSGELSQKMNLTASQIRQDFNCFGGFGQQGYGYNVQKLYQGIADILGVCGCYKGIIIGAGNIGQAVAKNEDFKRRGYLMEAIFDIRSETVGTSVCGMTIRHTDELESYLKGHPTDIAVLAVPKQDCSQLVKRVAGCGVKGIWNFSPVDLHEEAETYGLVVENVHLSDSLMVLGYRLRNEI